MQCDSWLSSAILRFFFDMAGFASWWSWTHLTFSSEVMHDTKCYLNLPLECVVRITGGQINHRVAWLLIIGSGFFSPKGWRSKGLSKCSFPQSGEEDDEDPDGEGRKGRKKIRKILKDDKLRTETRDALKEEEDRRKRIAEREALREKLREVNIQSSVYPLPKLSSLKCDIQKDAWFCVCVYVRDSSAWAYYTTNYLRFDFIK